MTLLSIGNLKKNMNIGWIALIIYLIAMTFIFLITNPPMVKGAEMYGTALVLLVIGLALEG